MRFPIFVLIAPETADVVQEITRLLAPYDLNNEDVPIEQVHWDGWIWHDRCEMYPPLDAPVDHDPLAVVTPDGQWHDFGAHWWKRTAEQEQAVQAEIRKMIMSYPTYLVIELDCHM